MVECGWGESLILPLIKNEIFLINIFGEVGIMYLQQLITYLNDNSGAMTFLITVLYVVATILICWANIKSANASKIQLEEMRKQYAEENRPNVEVELLYEKRLFYGLRFINHGKCTAQHVQIKLDTTFIDSITESSFADSLNKQNGKECIIGVGQHYDLFFGTNKYRKNPNKVAATGTIYYQGSGNTYQSDFLIDLENYATIFSVNSEQEDLFERIEMQTYELKGIKQAIQSIEVYFEEKGINE